MNRHELTIQGIKMHKQNAFQPLYTEEKLIFLEIGI